MFKPTLEYHLRKIESVPECGCWLWTGTIGSHGYGRVLVDGRQKMAHRYIYEAMRGDISDDKQLDHLCRVRCCVNPDHLEVVDARTNTLRGFGRAGINARKTHCMNGHDFTLENTYYDGNQRNCRICGREKELLRRDRKLITDRAWWHRVGKWRALKKAARQEFAEGEEQV